MSSRLMTQLLGYAGLLPFFGFALVSRRWKIGRAHSQYKASSFTRLPFFVFWPVHFGGRNNKCRALRP